MNKTVKVGKKTVELKESERQPCEVWSRVMGYHRPTAGWNIGKTQEFKDRVYYKESKALGRSKGGRSG